MRITLIGIVLVLIAVTFGCANRATQAPVPGSVNSFDAWAFRIVDDSDASVHQAKIWEQCTEKSPATVVTIDGKDEKCSVDHPFPMAYKGDLNLAIDALNVAKTMGASYHSGATQDTQALTEAINKLSVAVAALLSHIGGKP